MSVQRPLTTLLQSLQFPLRQADPLVMAHLKRWQAPDISEAKACQPSLEPLAVA